MKIFYFDMYKIVRLYEVYSIIGDLRILRKGVICICLIFEYYYNFILSVVWCFLIELFGFS